MDIKKQKWPGVVLVIICLSVLFLLNSFLTRKTDRQKTQDYLANHMGVLIFVKSGTEQDRDFLTALKEAKRKLKDKAGIVITNDKNFLEEYEIPPTLVIIDAHSNILARIGGIFNKPIFDETVDSIVSHTH